MTEDEEVRHMAFAAGAGAAVPYFPKALPFEMREKYEAAIASRDETIRSLRLRIEELEKGKADEFARGKAEAARIARSVGFKIDSMKTWGEHIAAAIEGAP